MNTAANNNNAFVRLALSASENLTTGAQVLGYDRNSLSNTIDVLPLELIGALFVGLDSVRNSTQLDWVKKGCLHSRHASAMQTIAEKAELFTILEPFGFKIKFDSNQNAFIDEPISFELIKTMGKLQSLKQAGYKVIPSFDEEFEFSKSTSFIKITK